MTHHARGFKDLIRQRGYRVTPQRQLILDAICDGGGHLTPDEIYERVRLAAPAVNRATVYRNLDFLCDIRLVVAAQIGRRTVYEIAGEAPHHHLVCRRCNAMSSMEHSVVAQFFRQIVKTVGFAVDMDHLTLFGLCPECLQAGAASRSAG